MNNAATLKILILDDQGLVRAGMKELIRISEPQAFIREAASYDEAVASLSTEHVDIAFLDYDLKAERTGIDVLKFLRAADIGTRAIMLSGRSERELVIECLSAGAAGFILKDMDSNGIFRKALETVFQGGIFLPAELMAYHSGPVHPTSPATVTIEALGVTGRSAQVLYYLCQGLPNKSIALRMGIEEGTIRRDYVPRLFRAFRVARRTELMMEVFRRGVIVPEPGTHAAPNTPD